MEVDLKELIATLAVGIFFIVGIQRIFYNFFGLHLFTESLRDTYESASLKSNKIILIKHVQVDAKPDETDNPLQQYVIGGVLLSLCFIFGMIIEDFSNVLVDDDGFPFNKLVFLSADDEIKSNVFFGEDINKAGEEIFVKESKKSDFVTAALTYNLLHETSEKNVREFTNYMNNLQATNTIQTFKEYLKASGKYEVHEDIDAIAKKKLKDIARNLYYDAKGEVYRNQFYYDELKRIQQRIDFSRSMVFISVLLLALTIIFTIAKLFLPALWVKKRFRTEEINWKKFIAAVITLLIIYFFAQITYTEEEEQYNKRIFGYYKSLKSDAAEKLGIKSQSEDPTFGIEEGKPAIVANIADSEYVKLMEKAQTDSLVIISLFKGDKVTILGPCNEWSKVRYKLKIGYIYSKYLQEIQPSP